MSDNSIIKAIETALEASPDDGSLQLHLAGLYLESGEDAKALELAKRVLNAEPANTSALDIASTTSRRLDLPEADGYDSLLTALQGQPASSPRQDPGPSSAATSDPHSPTEPQPDRPDLEQADNETVETKPVETESIPQSADELIDVWKDKVAPEEVLIGEITKADMTLADVGGMAEAKEHITKSFLMPMQNPELQKAFGQTLQGGLLLWGPPGCGKTFMAKAVAGELGANFYHVGISDVLDSWTGNSEKNITGIFDTCRRNSPCVLFFDELDALGQKRTQIRASTRGVINQLLMEMDGSNSDNEGVFILAASNHPWDIDTALLRPGRIDRTVLVLPPDEEARASILQFHLRGKPLAQIDYLQLAKMTNGLTGADLMLVAKQATEYAMTDSIGSGVVSPITPRHLMAAVQTVRPSHLPWIESAKNYAMFNNSNGNYDGLIAWIKANKY